VPQKLPQIYTVISAVYPNSLLENPASVKESLPKSLLLRQALFYGQNLFIRPPNPAALLQNNFSLKFYITRMFRYFLDRMTRWRSICMPAAFYATFCGRQWSLKINEVFLLTGCVRG